MSEVWARLRGAWQRPDVALFHAFRKAPFGGANQFFMALREELRRRGYRVSASLIGPTTRACILNSYAFDVERLRRSRHAGCRVVHRVDGPVGLYRGKDDALDREIARLNHEFADATIFQSRYSLEAHRALGLELREPCVIPNAADPALFHAHGRAAWDCRRRLRLIATSWSDNPNKGAPTLRRVEARLDWDRYEFSFVGRAPVAFERIRALPPLGSAPLARLLRSHDVFVAPGLHEACSNAVIEALSCGLPVVYANSGGHAELVGDAGVPFETAEELPAAVERVAREYDRYRAAIRAPRLADVASRYLVVMGMSQAAASQG